eukprot:m.155972 g.155972  ORF g.155972 m.155972 type:complete len:598 (-) comp23599_c0_seq1:72-1865(-)
MASVVEIAIIAVLAFVAVICIVVVVLLVRWVKRSGLLQTNAKKRRRKRRHSNGTDSDDSDSMVDDASIEMFAPSARLDDFDDPEDWGWASAGTSLQGGSGPPLLFGDLGGGPVTTSSPHHKKPASLERENGTWNPMHVSPGTPGGHTADDVMNPKRGSGRRQAGPERSVVFGVTRRDTFGHRRLHKVVIPEAQTLKGLGITLKGDGPIFVAGVEAVGPAAAAGLRPDDCLVTVNGTACASATHGVVVELVKKAVVRAQAAARSATYHQNPVGPMVVLPGATQADASLSDVNVGTVHTRALGATRVVFDPYSLIREAASQQQLEASRLMQIGQFAQARVLLDKAIELLSSIPLDPNSTANSGGLKPPTQRVVEDTAGHVVLPPRARSFVPLRHGARVIPGKSLPKRHGKLKGHEVLGQVTVVTAETRDCIPRVSFRPIKRSRTKRTKPKNPAVKSSEGNGGDTRPESIRARPVGALAASQRVNGQTANSSFGSNRSKADGRVRTASSRKSREGGSVKLDHTPARTPKNGAGSGGGRTQAWGDVTRSAQRKSQRGQVVNPTEFFEIEAGEDNVVTSKIISRGTSNSSFAGFSIIDIPAS